MRRLVPILAICLCLAASADAQVIFRQPPSVTSQPTFQIWEQSKDSVSETLSQFSLPVYLFYPLENKGELKFSAVFAHSRYTGPGNEGRLGALGDLGIDYVNDFWQDRAAFNIGLSLPVGVTGLSSDEFFLAQQIASPLLPFRVKHYGEGLNLSGGLAVTSGQSWLYGASLRGTYRGTYTPIEGGTDYRPGSTVDLIAEALSANRALLLSAIATIYTSDQLDGESFFRDGRQLDFGLTWSPVQASTEHEFSGRVILRGKDRRRDTSGALRTEDENSNGTDFRLGYAARRALGEDWQGKAGLAYKHLGANGYPIDSLRYRGSGDLVSISAELTRAWGAGQFRFGALLFFGSAAESRRLSLAEPDERLAIKGLQLHVGHLWEW